MPPDLPDLPKLAAALVSEDVQHVLVGDFALVLYGGSRFAIDSHIEIVFRAEDRRSLVKPLAPLDPRPLRLAPGAAWVWDELCIRSPWSLFQNTAGKVDLT